MHHLYLGTVSTSNNGGFTSIRTKVTDYFHVFCEKKNTARHIVTIYVLCYLQ